MRKQIGAVRLIDIVAVLILCLAAAAILFPIFAKSGTHPRISCLSNLKQMGLGIAQYVQDNDGLLPAGPRLQHVAGWAGAIYPYIKTVEVYKCTEDTATKDKSGAMVRYPVSYALNAVLAPQQTTKDSISTGAYVDVPDASRTILCFEVRGSRAAIMDPEEGGKARVQTSLLGNGLDLTAYGPADVKLFGDSNKLDGAQYATGHVFGWNGTAQANQWMDHPAHEAGSGYLLADGHVKLYPPESVSVVQDDAHKIFWRQPSTSTINPPGAIK